MCSHNDRHEARSVSRDYQIYRLRRNRVGDWRYFYSIFTFIVQLRPNFDNSLGSHYWLKRERSTNPVEVIGVFGD
jgi:hypothetical protein